MYKAATIAYQLGKYDEALKYTTLIPRSANEYDLSNKLASKIKSTTRRPDPLNVPLSTIDTTTLDNTKAETSVLGLQPAAEVTYEINMMTLADVPVGVSHNVRAVKAMAGDKVKARWIVVKASGVIIEYDAVSNISYTADAQQDIEKFSIYHDVKSDIVVSLPAER